MADTKISIKLLVDKEKNKVVFAECDKDFADILFSFLTLPLGTVIRLLNKNSEVGCVDNLYRSVESLEMEYFETEACKSMLLRPRSDIQNKYRNLVVNVDDSTVENIIFYRCPTWTCCTVTHRLMSKFQNAKCICGEKMDKELSYVKLKLDEKDNLAGVFVKGIRKFIISDDLQIRAVSRETSWATLCSLGVKDVTSIEERTASVGTEEVLNLLKRCMFSKIPLTDVFLQKKRMIKMNQVKTEPLKIKPELLDALSDCKKMVLNLVIDKSDNKVLFAVVDQTFLDFLFSFLTIPLGCIEKLHGHYLSVGSLHKLYSSVEKLSKENPEKFHDSKDMLINPNIACHYGIENQILQLEVQESCNMRICNCSICLSKRLADCICTHDLGHVNLRLMNPKHGHATIQNGGGFVKEFATFMVTDALVVEPHSPISTFSFINKLGIPFSKIVERTVSIGEEEALSILRSSLSSKTVFTNVFCRMN